MAEKKKIKNLSDVVNLGIEEAKRIKEKEKNGGGVEAVQYSGRTTPRGNRIGEKTTDAKIGMTSLPKLSLHPIDFKVKTPTVKDNTKESSTPKLNSDKNLNNSNKTTQISKNSILSLNAAAKSPTPKFDGKNAKNDTKTLVDYMDFDLFNDTNQKIMPTIQKIYNDEYVSPLELLDLRAGINYNEKKLSAYQDYYNLYGKDSGLTDLSELDELYKYVQNDMPNITEYYKNFDSKESFDNWKKGMSVDIESFEESTKTLTKDFAESIKYNDKDSFAKNKGYKNFDDLKTQAIESNELLKLGKSTQGYNDFEQVGNTDSKYYDADFEKYTEFVDPKNSKETPYGISVSSTPYYEIRYRYINGDDEERRNIKYYEGDNAGMDFTGYEQMTDQQKKTYNYYYNNPAYGPEKAEEYFQSIKGQLAIKHAPYIAEKNKGNYLFALESGASNSVEGIRKAIDAVFDTNFSYKQDQTATELASSIIREGIEEENGILGTVGYDLISAVGEEAIEQPVTMVNPWAGAVFTGVSSAGNAYYEALNEGYTKSEAKNYAIMKGSLTGAIDKVLGTVGNKTGVGKKWANNIGALSDDIDNALLRVAIRTGGNAAPEALEGATESFLEPFLKNIATNGKANANVDWEQVIYDGIMEGLAGGVLSIPGSISADINRSNYLKQVGTDVLSSPQKTKQIVALGIENNVPEAAKFVNAIAKSKTPTAKETGRMVEKVISQSITNDGGMMNIMNIISTLEGNDSSYVGSMEAVDTAKAVMHLAEGKTTDVDRALISRSDGATTLLTAIEHDSKAFNSIKNAAKIELKDTTPSAEKVQAENKYSTENVTISKGNVYTRDGKKATITKDADIENGIVLSEEQKRFKEKNAKGYKVLEKWATELKKPVKLVKGLYDEDGKIVAGVEASDAIYINTEATNPVKWAASHEFSHTIKKSASETWAKYENYVINKKKKDGSYYGIFKAKEKAYGTDNVATINEEIAADYIGDAFDSVEELADFIKKDRGLAIKVRDAYYKVLDKLNLLDEKKKAQLMWRDAYRKAVLNVKEGKVESKPAEKKSVSGTRESEIDAEYLELAKNPEQNKAKLDKMVYEAAKEAGYTEKVYHGTTDFGFTRIKTSKSDDFISFFATSSLELANTYSGVLGETSIKKGNKGSVENQQRYERLVDNFVNEVNKIAGRDTISKDSLPFDDYLNKIRKGKMTLQQLSSKMSDYVLDVIDEIQTQKKITKEEDQQIWQMSTELESALYGLDNRSGNYGMYANTDNFLIIEGNGARWSKIPFDKIPSKTTANTRDITAWAKDNGYDGVMFKDIYDVGNHGTTHGKTANVYAFLKPETQLKSADPVTYNVFGKAIPLSKRFNNNNNDLRYSRPGTRESEINASATSKIEKLEQKLDLSNKNTTRKAIDSDYNYLSQIVRNPTDAKHIPEDLRPAVAKLLNCFNYESKHIDKLRAEGKEMDSPTAVRVADMYNAYTNIIKKSWGVETTENSQFADQFLTDDLKEMIGDIPIEEDGNFKRLEDMSINELRAMAKVLRSVHHAITTRNKAFNSAIKEKISELGYNASKDFEATRNRRGDKVVAKALKGLDGYFNYSNVQPWDFFHGLGGTMEKLYMAERTGFDKHILNIKAAQEALSKATVGIDLDKLDKKVWFKTDMGEELKLSKGQILSLYALYGRKQGKEHILGGGIVTNEKAKYADGKPANESIAHAVTETDMGRLFDEYLTAEEKEMASQIVDFMSKECAKWGNETSMKLYGYEKFGESWYFPIKVSKATLNQFSGEKGEGNQRSQSFTKKTTKKASNAVEIGDFFDTVTSHINGVSLYNSTALPMLDMERVLNYTESGTNTKVRADVIRTFGKNAEAYINKFHKDENESTKTEKSALEKLGNLNKKASIGFNARVLLQQPTSIARAYMFLSPKDIPASIKGAALIKEMRETCPIAYWKSLGFRDIGTGTNMKNVLLNNESLYSKLEMGGYGLADDFTWGLIYGAVKNEIKRKNPDLDVTSKEYKDKVRERFNYIIDRTQVVDSVFHRTQNMRSDNALVKNTTMFMSEALKTYNLYRTEMIDAAKEGRLIKTTARATAVYTVSNFLLALMQAFPDAWREDDEKELFDENGKPIGYWSRYWENVEENFVNNINPLNSFPIIKDVWSMVQGFQGERVEYSRINDLIISAKNLENNKKSLPAKLTSLTTSAAAVFGISAGNLKRDVFGLAETVFRANGDEYNDYLIDKFKYNVKNSSNKNRFMKHYERAISNGHPEDAAIILEDYLSENYNGKFDNKHTKTVVKEVSKLYGKTKEDQSKLIFGVPEQKFSFDGEDVQISDKDYPEYVEGTYNTLFDLAYDMINDERYKDLPIEEKVRNFGELEQFAEQSQRPEYIEGYELDGGWKNDLYNGKINYMDSAMERYGNRIFTDKKDEYKEKFVVNEKDYSEAEFSTVESVINDWSGYLASKDLGREIDPSDDRYLIVYDEKLSDDMSIEEYAGVRAYAKKTAALYDLNDDNPNKGSDSLTADELVRYLDSTDYSKEVKGALFMSIGGATWYNPYTGLKNNGEPRKSSGGGSSSGNSKSSGSSKSGSKSSGKTTYKSTAPKTPSVPKAPSKPKTPKF